MGRLVFVGRGFLVRARAAAQLPTTFMAWMKARKPETSHLRLLAVTFLRNHNLISCPLSITASGYLGPIFGLKILKIARYSCG
ncbi:MAG: hypothetical protein KJP07_23780, partial [Desulfatitalea sp.]|nr:hypothetical protein [Desulfatitalea sp.]